MQVGASLDGTDGPASSVVHEADSPSANWSVMTHGFPTPLLRRWVLDGLLVSAGFTFGLVVHLLDREMSLYV